MDEKKTENHQDTVDAKVIEVLERLEAKTTVDATFKVTDGVEELLTLMGYSELHHPQFSIQLEESGGDGIDSPRRDDVVVSVRCRASYIRNYP